MKKISIVAGIIMATAAIISTASAVTHNTSALGTMLAASGADQQYISQSLSSGVSNTSTAAKYVYGSLGRNAGNLTVAWTGYSNNTANSNYCCVLSQHWGSSGYTAKCDTFTGVNGYYTRSVTFTAAEAPAGDAFVAYCRLLETQKNRIYMFQATP